MKPPLTIRQSSAFTLIELVLVIAVIAVLAVLAFPVLTRMQESGKVAKNVNNLKALGTAYLTYAAENNGRIPQTMQNIRRNGKSGEGLFMTTGIDMWPTGSPRRLFTKENWEFGTGPNDYLGSPDVFYGPFTPTLNANRQSGEVWERVATAYRIGYVFYYQVLEDDSDAGSSGTKRVATNDPSGRPIINSHLSTGHPRAPLFSDITSEAWAKELGFPWETVKNLYVVHLDGSVDSVPAERIKYGNENKVFTMAGFVRQPK